MHPAQHHKQMATFSLLDKDESTAGYLLRRAGFGAPPDGISAGAEQGLGTLVGTLVDYASTPDNFAPPPEELTIYQPKRNVYTDFNVLSAWWLERMLTTSRPLQEKMTLFWHGHFATAYSKVRSAALMYRQNQLFRDNAMGRFDDLLSAVYKDPAMLIWLDGYRNIKNAPNENWGREVMELFTLGHGNYTEDDVHACSRCFTGWRLDMNAQPVFAPRLHDEGEKTLLGQTGNWDGEDAVRILAAHPATGPFLATKLWRFFASDQPSASAIQLMAGVYYTSGHVIREMVRTMFTIPEFYALDVRNGHIKSPTEFVVTSLKQLGLASVDVTTLPHLLAFLGQELFNPPNVGGWPGGPTWINASTMLGRFNFAAALTGTSPRGTGAVDPAAILTASAPYPAASTHNVKTGGRIVEALADYITDMLGIAVTSATRRALLQYAGTGPLDDTSLETKIRGLVHLALVSPEYQAS